jgi:hypothetical protein
MLVPLHANRAADPPRRCAVISGGNLDTAVQMYGPFAVLVIPERLERQRQQGGLLFSKHGRNLPFGGAVDACVGPMLFPPVEIRLGFRETLEAHSFERCPFRVPHTRLDFSLAVGMHHAAGHRRRAIVAEHVAVQRIQRRIVDIGLQHALAQIIEDDDARDSAEPMKRLFVQFGPDARAGLEREQPNRFAAVAKRQDEEAGATVLARVWIADHGPVAVIDLRFLARRRLDDGACLPRGATEKFADKALDALVMASEAVMIDQFLPDRLRVAARCNLRLDPLAPWLAGTG